MSSLLPPRAAGRAALRRALRLPAVLLAAGAPLARADAQAACGAGTLAEYLATGFSCRIGGWTLSEFSGSASVDAQGRTTGIAAEAGSIRVTPFRSVDATGRRIFGFDLDGFTASSAADGTTSGLERAFAYRSLGFWITTAVPGLRLVGAVASGVLDVANATPEMLRAGASLGGSVTALDGSRVLDCQLGLATSSTAPAREASVGGECAQPLSGTILVNVGTGATLDRFTGQPAPVSGSSQGAITRLQFVEAAPAVVPEPATVTLLAGGLVAVLAVGRRRARAG